MAMTKKHYEAFAKAVNNHYDHLSSAVDGQDMADALIHALIHDLVAIFKPDNPSFNAQRFRDACMKE